MAQNSWKTWESHCGRRKRAPVIDAFLLFISSLRKERETWVESKALVTWGKEGEPPQPRAPRSAPCFAPALVGGSTSQFYPTPAVKNSASLSRARIAISLCRLAFVPLMHISPLRTQCKQKPFFLLSKVIVFWWVFFLPGMDIYICVCVCVCNKIGKF